MGVSLTQLGMVDSLQDGEEISVIYNTTVLCLFVFIPFMITLVAFARIFFIIKQGAKSRMKMSAHVRKSFTHRRKQRKNEKRSLLVYLTMLVCFMFGWFPYFFLTLLMDIDYSLVKDIPYWINVTFLFMKISSSLIDPLLFTFFKSDFQKALRNFAHGSLKAFRVNSTDSTRTTRKTAEF